MNRTFDLAGPVSARIVIEGGAVEVDTVDATQARVEVMRERGGEPGDELFVGMRDGADGPELVVELSRGGFLSHFGHDRDLFVRVQIPHGSRLRVSTASADVKARGTYSGAVFHTASGDMSIGRIAGDLDMKTASGDIEAESIAGKLVAQSASGDLQIHRTDGEVSLRTASGDVGLDEVAGERVEVHTASGDVEIREVVRASVSVQSASGDISIGIRRGSRVWLDVRSLSGETQSEFELNDQPDSEEGPLVEVRAMSMSGDIAIRRASAVVV
ncbi:MAG: DUF4097 domain-containing protein [Actinomycetota bacterium]|nr:DUF4097 domain-containing protein [Actinomycetota bacterium]